MSSWPNAFLIRIVRGSLGEVPLNGALAVNAGLGAVGPYFKYHIIRGPGTGHMLRRDDSDYGIIDEWEELVPVPIGALKDLNGSTRGLPLPKVALAAVLKVTEYLPDSEPTPLDRSVAEVEKLLSGPDTLLDTPPEMYLARLLGTLATYHDVEHSNDVALRQQAAQAIAWVVKLCVKWVVETAPAGSRLALTGGVLEEVRARVESDPTVGGFTAMAALAGTAAKWIDDAEEDGEGQRRLSMGLIESVLDLAHYALASLAKCLKSGE